MNFNAKDLEEAMTILWKDIETKNAAAEKVREKLARCIGDGAWEQLAAEGFTAINDGGDAFFTDKGYKRAFDLVRRHRLTERLLVDVLRMDREKVDTEACALEHIISKELEEIICTLLGHPRVCPHGSPIMPGECCRKNLTRIDRAIYSLAELKHGEGGIVSYVQTSVHPFMHKLLSLGLVPGVAIKVHQTFPSYVIEFEQTQLAVEKEIASNVFVRKA